MESIARRTFVNPPACEEGVRSEFQSLNFWTGAGIILFSAGMTTLGLCANACWRATPRQRAKRRAWRNNKFWLVPHHK